MQLLKENRATGLSVRDLSRKVYTEPASPSAYGKHTVGSSYLWTSGTHGFQVAHVHKALGRLEAAGRVRDVGYDQSEVRSGALSSAQLYRANLCDYKDCGEEGQWHGQTLGWLCRPHVESITKSGKHMLGGSAERLIPMAFTEHELLVVSQAVADFDPTFEETTQDEQTALYTKLCGPIKGLF